MDFILPGHALGLEVAYSCLSCSAYRPMFPPLHSTDHKLNVGCSVRLLGVPVENTV